MKRTATLTWNTYCNFGTFLQAYALQQVIKSMGYENKIIDDERIVKRFSPLGKIKGLVKYLILPRQRKYVASERVSKRLYEQFKTEELDVDYCIDADHLNEIYDVFVCGSDQIWNTYSMICPQRHFFYATFTNKKKVAYAPSINAFELSSDKKKCLKELVKDFYTLSAREENGVKLLQEASGKEVSKVVDPTLLLNKREWEKLLEKRPRKITEKYVLGYFLTPNDSYIAVCKEFAHRRGLKFKMFYNFPKYISQADEVITAGPIEFLEAIRGAEYVMTDSFHGSIFSYLFEVPLFHFIRFHNENYAQNARVVNLLAMLGIDSHLIDTNNFKDIEMLDDIDYEKAKLKIQPQIDLSREYLRQALN